jgi:hypothetical protein
VPHEFFATSRSRVASLSFMPPRLEPLREALRALPNDALHALRDVSIQTGHFAPSFTAWIKHVADWELDRRGGMHYFLLFPEELAPPDEFARDARRALAEIRRALGGTGGPNILASVLEALGCLLERCERYR